MGIRAMVQQYRESREIKRFRIGWTGLVPGDVVEYKGQRYRYICVNNPYHPRNIGFPDPIFGPATPTVPDKIWYLRSEHALRTEYLLAFELSNITRKLIMNDSAQPIQAGDSRIDIASLRASRDDLNKVGHITPSEWKAMVEELRTELAGTR